MIRVYVEYFHNTLTKMVIKGHGGLEKGNDIYCAGVSSCLIGALNALENAEHYSIKIESGYCEVVTINPSTEHDKIVLETLIVQLKTIADNYPQRVQTIISKKEGKK